MKGIILAGGKATRIRPVTDVLSKQILPIYDKPMIYYPLSVLMLAGIKDILLISTPEFTPSFEELLGDGARFGIHIKYKIQKEANGLAQAFIIGEEFVNKEPCALILGDNILWGEELEGKLKKAVKNVEEGFVTVFCRQVDTPADFGVAVYNEKTGIVSKLVEKPTKYVSNEAVIGLYFYDSKACDYAKTLTPSARGELEITDLNKKYVEEKALKAIPLKKEEFEWNDAGSFEGLFKASEQVRLSQNNGAMIASPDEIAFQKGWISQTDLLKIAQKYGKSKYGEYLEDVARKSRVDDKKADDTMSLDFLDELK
ncbi:sugar nucleotidyltransferase [Fibrobacter sp.]|uniref:sugar nucleotidyltransferase n=1 Tax=Fibrobacter sp. TaxID=35828 RepID=UPI003866078C